MPDLSNAKALRLLSARQIDDARVKAARWQWLVRVCAAITIGSMAFVVMGALPPYFASKDVLAMAAVAMSLGAVLSIFAGQRYSGHLADSLEDSDIERLAVVHALSPLVPEVAICLRAAEARGYPVRVSEAVEMQKRYRHLLASTAPRIPRMRSSYR